MKRMRGAVPVQDLSRAIVEHHLHAFDLRTGDLSKPCALEKELAQQTIGVPDPEWAATTDEPYAADESDGGDGDTGRAPASRRRWAAHTDRYRWLHARSASSVRQDTAAVSRAQSVRETSGARAVARRRRASAHGPRAFEACAAR